LGFSFILIVYGLAIVVMALLNDRVGVLNVIISVALGLILFGYDLLTYEGFFTYNGVLLSLGYISIFSLLGVALLRHLKILKNNSSNELRFDELFKAD
jgi:hypothetical protein